MGRSWCITVLLGVAFQVVAARAYGEEPAGACTTMPANVQMPRALHAAVDHLLAQSSTLRRQCAVIAAAAARAKLMIVIVRPDLPGCRARASFARTSSGHLDAHIDVPFTRDFPELIAHELEHVVEQIEGLNLRRLSEQPATGVDEVATGTFETARAREAGRAAALEVQVAARLARARVLSVRPSATVARLRP
jgi:hypothetical protein